MASFTATISGTSGYQLIMQVTESTLDIANNRSLVAIYMYVHQTGGSGIWGSGTYSASVNGTPYSGGFSYDFRSEDDHVLINTTQWVTHDADGSKTISFSGSVDMANSPYATTGNGSSTLALTTFDLYAAVSTFTITNVAITTFDMNVTTDATCSLLEYSLNDGSSYTTGYSGSYTSKTLNITGLTPGTLYQCKVRITKSDSGRTTVSSRVEATTLTVGFFDSDL